MRTGLKKFFAALATASTLTAPVAAQADGLNLNLNLGITNGQVRLNGGNVTIHGNNSTLRGIYGNGTNGNYNRAVIDQCRRNVTGRYVSIYGNGQLRRGTPAYRAYSQELKACGPTN